MSEKIKNEQFVSLKFRNLRIVLDPQTKKEVQGSLVASSVYGKFPTGFTVEFQDGIYNTSDQAVIEALKNHPNYGAMFVCTSDKGAVQMGEEAVRMTNERRAIVSELSSKCPKCGKSFKNADGLKIHMRVHEKEAN